MPQVVQGGVADALKGLTQYLFVENQRLDKQNKEKKVELAAQRVAKRFQSLPPDATQQDIQQAEFGAIEDAAALGSLKENLPLIGGLFRSILQTRSSTIAEAQDLALNKAVEGQFGITAPGTSGSQLLQLSGSVIQSRQHSKIQDESGQTYLATFDSQGKEIPDTRFKVNPDNYEAQFERGKQKADYNLQTQEKLIRFQTNETIRLNQVKAKLKQGPLIYGIGSDGEIPSNMVTPMKGYQTPDGQPLFTSKVNNLPMVLAKDGYRYYTGKQVKSQQVGGDTHDIMTSLQDVRQTFSTAQKEQILSMAGIEAPNGKTADEVINAITGSTGDLVVTGDNSDINIVNTDVIPKIDSYLSHAPEEQTKILNRALKDKDLMEDDGTIEPENQSFVNMLKTKLTTLGVLYKTKIAQRKSLMESLPGYGENTISIDDWNTGVESLDYIFNNKNALPDSLNNAIKSTLSNMLGIPADSLDTITMDTFRQLNQEQQIPFIKKISDNTHYLQSQDANKLQRDKQKKQDEFNKYKSLLESAH